MDSRAQTVYLETICSRNRTGVPKTSEHPSGLLEVPSAAAVAAVAAVVAAAAAVAAAVEAALVAQKVSYT